MRKATAGVVLLLFLGLAFGVFVPADAQDDSDARLSALETQVADLETRLAALEQAQPPSTEATDSSSTTAGVVKFEGMGGKTTTDIVEMGGTYLVSGTCAAGYFDFDTTNLNAPDDFVFVGLYGEAPFDGSVVYSLDPGRYIFSVSCDGPWTLTFEPLT